jgi:hypothetical protein
MANLDVDKRNMALLHARGKRNVAPVYIGASALQSRS